MTERTSDTSITILRMTNFSRAIVLFTMAGLSSVVFSWTPFITYFFLFLLVLDITGFLFLLTSRVPLRQFGYVWSGLMSIALMLYTSGYIGSTHLFPDVIVIMLLSCIQLLTLMRIGINTYVNTSLGDETL